MCTVKKGLLGPGWGLENRLPFYSVYTYSMSGGVGQTFDPAWLSACVAGSSLIFQWKWTRADLN